MRPHFILLHSVGFALAMSGAAAAHPSTGTSDGVQQVSVSLADLRLDTATGRQVAHARLQRAAEQVCGPAPSHLADLEAMSAFEACRLTALQDAEQHLVRAEAAARPVLASALARR